MKHREIGEFENNILLGIVKSVDAGFWIFTFDQINQFVDDQPRHRSAGTDPDLLFSRKDFHIELAGAVDDITRDTFVLAGLAQAVAVGTVRRAADDNDVAELSQFLDGILTVLGGVTNIGTGRSDKFWKFEF